MHWSRQIRVSWRCWYRDAEHDATSSSGMLQLVENEMMNMRAAYLLDLDCRCMKHSVNPNLTIGLHDLFSTIAHHGHHVRYLNDKSLSGTIPNSLGSAKLLVSLYVRWLPQIYANLAWRIAIHQQLPVMTQARDSFSNACLRWLSHALPRSGISITTV